MKNLQGTIVEIESCDALHIVKIKCDEQILKMISLQLDDTMQIGKCVTLICKPSSVAIAKNFTGELSYSNQIPVVINSISEGEMVCSLKLKFNKYELESIITKSSCDNMNLKVGQNVTALIKANELSISQVN